ncbi:amidohydrolase family protein [Kiloniella laminariae]|uniref:Amidohydrolase family protein n=1 Tax=Kiloniella laminariae TaxID=454162 RepID=A0ABT4LGS1_9PROT|nr:amidohydrolase family protein [Kiloniella laminariae]MCZ4280292.1 amidohydrolase family protein [Kiloniella laminariae]
MLDLLIKNASLPDGRKNMDIAISADRIVAVEPNITTGIEVGKTRIVDAVGHLLSPPFIDPHFHLDSTLSLGQPRLNESGTLLEGIQLWGELKPHLTAEAIKKRVHALARWSIARGTLAIRSHVDTSDDRLLAVEALLEARKELAPWIDIQLVAFPQDGYFRYGKAAENLKRALDLGVDVVGGIPHFERTMEDGARSVTALCEIAAKRGLMVDMHCDETDDPLSRHIETLTAETMRLGLQGRVAGSHLTSMHSMDNYYVSKLLPLIREADITAIPNPLINITLQGRHDSYPKRRGMTRIKEMTTMGINVALGHDCVMDPWYSFGSHDMLEVAHMATHVGQMTGVSETRAMFAAVTENSARVMHLPDYGIEKGNYADLVILQARDAIEAIRLRPARLFVIRRGQIISTTAPVTAELDLNGKRETVDFLR